MTTIIQQVFLFLATLLRLIGPGGLRSVAAEMVLLKHQLQIVARSQKRAPSLSPSDRLLLGLTSLLLKGKRLTRAAIIVKPATILAFHRALVQRKYSRLFGRPHHKKPGRKGPSLELVRFVLASKAANPKFGYGKIALMASRALGVPVDGDTVRRILQKRLRPEPGDGPSWLTFIGHAADSLWSLDFFRCESVLLQTHWIMLVMDQYSRKIKGFAIYAGTLDGPKVCWMLGRATAGLAWPTYLSTDHDPLFNYHQWGANLRVVGVGELKSVPYTPTSHPFIERLIGTVRREYLDHVLFWGAADLERKLKEFVAYYNDSRVHYALDDGRTPAEKFAGQPQPSPVNVRTITWRSHCRGLFRTPIAA